MRATPHDPSLLDCDRPEQARASTVVRSLDCSLSVATQARRRRDRAQSTFRYIAIGHFWNTLYRRIELVTVVCQKRWVVLLLFTLLLIRPVYDSIYTRRWEHNWQLPVPYNYLRHHQNTELLMYSLDSCLFTETCTIILRITCFLA